MRTIWRYISTKRSGLNSMLISWESDNQLTIIISIEGHRKWGAPHLRQQHNEEFVRGRAQAAYCSAEFPSPIESLSAPIRRASPIAAMPNPKTSLQLRPSAIERAAPDAGWPARTRINSTARPPAAAPA